MPAAHRYAPIANACSRSPGHRTPRLRLRSSAGARFCHYCLPTVSPDVLEAELRDYLVELMPLDHAPAHLRLAFHDARTYHQLTPTSCAHAAVRLLPEPDRLAKSRS